MVKKTHISHLPVIAFPTAVWIDQNLQIRNIFHSPALLFLESLNTACESPICVGGAGQAVCLHVHFYVSGFLASTLKTHTHLSISATCLSCCCLAIAYRSSQCPTPLAGWYYHVGIYIYWVLKRPLCVVWLREAFLCYYIPLSTWPHP